MIRGITENLNPQVTVTYKAHVMKNGTNFFKNHLNVYHFEDLNEMILNFFSNSTFRSVDNGILSFYHVF